MHVQVFRARVSPEHVDHLLEIREPAIRQARSACPDLLSAQLIRLDEETWLDVLTWTSAEAPARLAAHADRLDLVAEMHGLVEEVLTVDAGRLVHDLPA
jgi:hypothetical protein